MARSIAVIDQPTPISREARRLGVVAVLMATVFWSFGGVLGKSTGASGIVLSFWRMWVALAVLLAISAILRRWPSWADVRATASAGVLFGLNICVFFVALQHTSIAVVVIIGALSPVLVLPYARAFMGERVTMLKAVCATVAVTGVVVAVIVAPSGGGGSTTTLAGYLWSVASLLFWVAYMLVTKRVRDRVETVRFLTSVSGVAALTVSLLVVITGSELGQVSGTGWWWVVILAIGPGITGHGLVTWAQPRVDASVTTLLIQAEPVGATLAAWVFLSERVSGLQALAMAVVIAALCVLAYRESREGPILIDEAVS